MEQESLNCFRLITFRISRVLTGRLASGRFWPKAAPQNLVFSPLRTSALEKSGHSSASAWINVPLTSALSPEDESVHCYNAAMAMDSHTQGIRKSVLLTSMIGVVFAASETESINWIIKLHGWQAWAFLLAAHLYYSLMWRLHGHLRWEDVPPHGTTYAGPKRHAMPVHRADVPLFGKLDPTGSRIFMERTLTDVIAILGGVLIVTNFLVALENV